MKSNELIKLLKKHECYLIRQAKGSHEIWYSPKSKNEFSVPNHGAREIGTGLAEKILKLAGIKK